MISIDDRLARFEHLEEISNVVVILACAGEWVAFSKHPWRETVEKISTIVLTVALAFEFFGMLGANSVSATIMGDLKKEAGLAQETSKEAVGNSSDALGQSQKAIGNASDALEKSQKAVVNASEALGRIQEVNARSHVQTLIANMRDDDALAFDQLRAMKKFIDPEQEQSVKDAINQVIFIHQNSSYDGAAPPPWRSSVDEGSAELMLYASDSVARQQALRVLYPNDKFVPKLLEMTLSDPSLDVRMLALRKLNDCIGQRYQFGQDDWLRRWWNRPDDGKARYEKSQ